MSGSGWQCPAPTASKAETADGLRELIGQAERLVSNLRGAGPQAAMLLHLLDAIDDSLGALASTGVDLRAEVVRIETVQRMLQSRDRLLLAEVRCLGGLAAAREALKPAPDRWWWYLDERLAARRRQRLRRALLIAGGVTAVLFLLWGAYRLAFPPDLRRAAALERQGSAEQLLLKGDLAGAAECYRQAAELLPEDPELHIWAGVLEAQQGRAEAAATHFARAQALVPDQALYHVNRGMVWLRIEALEEAEADAIAALAIRPDCGEAYLLLGNVYEIRGERQQAIEALEQAAALAEKVGNSTLVVTAKVRLGLLLQAAPMMPAETPAP